MWCYLLGNVGAHVTPLEYYVSLKNPLLLLLQLVFQKHKIPDEASMKSSLAGSGGEQVMSRRWGLT